MGRLPMAAAVAALSVALTASAGAQEAGGERPTSTESGQSPLDESFGPRTHADWVIETRRKAWADTRFDVQIRSYYFDREHVDGSESEAWALGGPAGFKTGYFRERLALGATGYTSQPLYGPEDKDGSLLLKPGQEGYTVLGELYGELLFGEDTRLTVGRRGLDTPYVNRNDSRMTPNTFETIALQGLYVGGESEWRAGAGYVDRIKPRNSDDFVSMATAAGAPGGIERGVYVGGANYRNGDLSIGAVDYYSDDIINIFYAESKYSLPAGGDRRLQFALQYTDQRSVGDNRLLGTDFTAQQWGSKAEFAAGNALLTAAYTSATGDTGMQSPWSSYPGYTSVQVADFNRDGEEAWMLRAAYNFPSVKGLSAYALWVTGSDPEDPAEFARDEYDFNLQWSPVSGPLKGLMLRLRYAHSDQDELRLMVFYDPPSL